MVTAAAKIDGSRLGIGEFPASFFHFYFPAPIVTRVKLLQTLDRDRLEAAIRDVERQTTAELKVIVRRFCWKNLKSTARRAFRKFGLDQTRDRNAVLIYVVLANQELLIFGDRGIHERVPDGFWIAVKDEILASIPVQGLSVALVQGIQRIGAEMAVHFPRRDSDTNELPDRVMEDP